ncbi:MAG: sugar phosphate isomerase/epimerase family protein [Bryobacteraceae bacterium]
MLCHRRAFLSAAACAALGADRSPAATLKEVRLGVITDEIDEDVAKAAQFLRGFGLGWAEVRSVWGQYNTDQPVEKIREARGILDANRVRTSVVDTAFFRGTLPPETAEGQAALDKQWSLLDAAVERARLLGTDCLRTFAFTLGQGQRPDAGDLPRIHERIYELLREAARRARARNVRLAVENLEGSYVSTGAEAGLMLKNVREEALGLTWDPNNAAGSGERAFPDGYAQLDTARIFNVHLRDYRHTAEGRFEWCAAGEGEFDNLGQIRALVRNGYKGGFSLETHYKHPDGKAAATRASLTALLKIVERV